MSDSSIFSVVSPFGVSLPSQALDNSTSSYKERGNIILEADCGGSDLEYTLRGDCLNTSLKPLGVSMEIAGISLGVLFELLHSNRVGDITSLGEFVVYTSRNLGSNAELKFGWKFPDELV
ncbi:hypothetical protein OGATHE_002823 [Ogataea polymorpha]|uniref:Uncharacterized protein n=1 Tax=Ogataea polymorpha TaxID=460523 RepID=A0A9P8T986_9ASCO|nr:hypothetical protein OGATHE_002823 [Ogataea polymorpha]